MAGPALDPVKVSQFEKGFNGQSSPKPVQDPQSLAGALAKAYAAKMNGEQGSAPQTAPSASPAPMNQHAMAMQEAAEAAKQAYMKKYGVDENGDPTVQR